MVVHRLIMHPGGQGLGLGPADLLLDDLDGMDDVFYYLNLLDHLFND